MPDPSLTVEALAALRRLEQRQNAELDQRQRIYTEPGERIELGSKPAVVSGLTLTAGAQKILASWNAGVSGDIRYYELEVSATAAMADPDSYRTGETNFTVHKGEATGTDVYYMRVRAVGGGASLLRGDWSNVVSSTVGQAATVDVQDNAISDRDSDSTTGALSTSMVEVLRVSLSFTNGQKCEVKLSFLLNKGASSTGAEAEVWVDRPSSGDTILADLDPFVNDSSASNVNTYIIEYTTADGDGTYEFYVKARAKGGSGTAVLSGGYLGVIKMKK